MKRLLMVALAVLLFGICGFSGAATKFAGAYLEKPANGENGNVAKTLRVAETDKAIEITRVQDGKTTTSRFPLDGSEGDYHSPTGVVGRGTAHFKGKDLMLESIIVTKGEQNGPDVRMRTQERWQLSSDSKLLTIRFNVDYPDLNKAIKGVRIHESWTELYLRSDIQ